jgi:plastocyanin
MLLRTQNTHKSMLRALAAVAAMSLAMRTAIAAGVQVDVVDTNGHALRDVVVVATSAAPASAHAPTSSAASMDQLDKRFVPEVLVIRAGATVSFPNNDSVAHQVYSFSSAKRFELPLYRGRAHPPVVFDQPGIVVLGCNIHDHMAAYIFVTASPHFGKTNEHGGVLLTGLPAGNYRISVWSPYFNETPPEQSVALAATQTTELRFALTRNLRPQRPPIDPRIRDY